MYNTTTGGTQDAKAKYEWMGWGYDFDGVAFSALYIRNTTGSLQFPGSVDIISRSDTGPDSATVQVILGYVKQLGSSKLTSLAERVQPLNVDGRRVGIPPFSCNASCVHNANLLADQK